MIAKIVNGSCFRRVVKDILDKGKGAKILVCDGLFAENKDTIAMSFEAQSKLNPKITKPVEHISLAFHKEDEHRLTDRAMAGIALEYLRKMGDNRHAGSHRASLRQGASACAYSIQPNRQ